MKKTTNIMKKALCFIAAAFITTTASDTIAGNTWDGGGSSGSWSNSTNWDLNTLPSTGAPLIFVGNIQNNTTNNLTAGNPSFTGIAFQNNGAANAANAFTLAGSPITLAGNIGTTANITGTTITDIISLDIILNANSTITTRQLSPSVQHNLTISGIISETGGARTLTKSESGTLILSGANTYTGLTTVSAGTLTLSGNRTVNTTAGYEIFGVGTQTLNIQNGNYTIGGNFRMGGSGGAATVNHSAGTITILSGSGLNMGITSGSGGSAIYNLSGGSLTTGSISMGANSGSAASSFISTIAVSGTGALTVGTLRIGRYDSAGSFNTTSTFNQTAGATTVTTLALGGNSANATNSTGSIIANLNLTGGTFTATNIASLSAGGATTISNANSSFINIGGTAQVTLGTFGSIVKGQNSTATITFDSGATGFLAPVTNSTTYMPTGTFTRAFLTANGANFNVGSGKDITIGQVLENASGASGTLTKSGVGLLTLLGNNTYTGATTVSTGTLLVNNGTGSATGTGTVAVVAGATLGGSGAIAGATTIGGILAPGNSIGTLTVANDVIWNGNLLGGDATTDWKFELGAANTADLLQITGATSEFIKGTGTTFRFDFMGSTATGTFKLVDWDSIEPWIGGEVAGTNFSIADFTYTNLGGNNLGTFQFNGTQLEFQAIPEPSALQLFGIGLISLLACHRINKRNG
jgi:autotransporter-associated beta strand protein